MKIQRIWLAISVLVVLLAQPAIAQQCDASGEFVRSPGEQLTVEPSDRSTWPPTAKFDLFIIGRMIQDAPTIGRAEGTMDLTNDGCLGVYRESELCSLVFEFSQNAVKVRQIGNCGFGSGAYADGIFRIESEVKPQKKSSASTRRKPKPNQSLEPTRVGKPPLAAQL
jgi:hypothetical protein